MTKAELIKRLSEIGIISNEPVLLRSGVTAQFYCDMKKAYGYPDVLDALCEEVGKGIGDDITCIIGSGYGGVPLAAILSLRYKRNFALLREAIKDHGKQNPFDGYIPAKDDRVLIVDDVLTTGSSVRETIAALKKTEATIAGAVVLVKRGDVKLPIPYSHILHIDELR
ncbi:MAG: phosphoribosyltransferase family protein [bacterium]|nr:phosphoribosyltransferase family protein [bacterium]